MTISVVSTTKANSLSVTIPATTAHNCLVVCVDSFNTATQSVTGVTIGASADHFAQAVAAGGGVSAPLAAIWVDRDCAGGQTAIAISGSNLAVTSTDGGVVVYEIAGLDTASPLDVTHPGTGSGTAWTSGSTATTAQPSEIWVGTAGVNASAAGPGAPWVNTVSTGTFAVSGVDIVSSTGTAAYAGTAGSGAWSAAVITLKAAASAVSGTVQPVSAQPAPRRRRARARVLFAPVTGVNAAPAPPVSGTVQPVSAQPAPRRRRARARVLFAPVTGVNAAPAPPVSGTVQPVSAQPAPRRRRARAVVQGLAVPGVSALRGLAPAQRFTMPPRRRRARARVLSVPVAGVNAVQTRTLLISLASAAGTDDYLNSYPQGIFASAGVIQGPEFLGDDFIINTSGYFLYNGAPAAGNLAMSIAPAFGTDSFGNNYVSGAASYSGSLASGLDAGTITTYSGSLAFGWNAQAVIFTNGFGDLLLEAAPGRQVITANNILDGGGGGATFQADVSVNGGNLNVGNGSSANINLNPMMATPPNTAAVKAQTATLAQTQACLGALIQSLQNRNMVT